MNAPLARNAVVLFVIFAGLRSLLEIIAGPFPLGNDSLNLYDVWLRTGQPVDIYDLSSKLVLYGINDVLHDPTLSVKVMMICLQGSLAVALYFWLYSLTKDARIVFLAAL
ncbi:MAG: hypothetical protein ACYC9U_00880 [Nitrososphaerales archaeon]